MRIVDVVEITKPISSPIRNAYIDFTKMTTSLVAVVTDVVRDGRRVVGYGFNSNGRYGQGGLIRERFGRNVPEARDQIPQALAQLFKEPNPTLSIDLTTCRKSSRKSTTTEPENGLNGSVSLPSLLRSGSLMA